MTLELPFSFFLSFAKAMQCMEYSKILTKSYFATLNLTFIRGPQSFPSVTCRSSNYQITLQSRSTFQNFKISMHEKGKLSSVEHALVGRVELP